MTGAGATVTRTMPGSPNSVPPRTRMPRCLSASHDRDVVDAELDEHEVRLRRMGRSAGRLPALRPGPRARRPPRHAGGRRSPDRQRLRCPAASAARLTLNGSCTRSSSRATSGSEIAKPTRRPASPRIFENERMTITGRPVEHVAPAVDAHARDRRSRCTSRRRSRCSRAGRRSRKAAQAAGSMSVPVGLFGSQIQTRRASVSTAAVATASRSIARPAGGTRVTTPPAAARHRGVEAVGQVRDDDRRARADEDLRERGDQGLGAVRRREALGRARRASARGRRGNRRRGARGRARR